MVYCNYIIPNREHLTYFMHLLMLITELKYNCEHVQHTIICVDIRVSNIHLSSKFHFSNSSKCFAKSRKKIFYVDLCRLQRLYLMLFLYGFVRKIPKIEIHYVRKYCNRASEEFPSHSCRSSYPSGLSPLVD